MARSKCVVTRNILQMLLTLLHGIFFILLGEPVLHISLGSHLDGTVTLILDPEDEEHSVFTAAIDPLLKKSTGDLRVGKSYGIIGVPIEDGQRKIGPAEGPQRVREAGLLEALSGVDVKDYGDLSCGDVICTGELVARTVSELLKDGRIPITLGGDHTISLGTIHALVKNNPDTIVIWVDAHGDINVPDSSPSGNYHGMVLSMLAKELKDHWKQAPHYDWTGPPTFTTSNLIYMALRAVDQFEVETMEKFNITNYYMRDIDQLGVATALNRALKSADPQGKKPLFISFDIDALDPEFAPSTGTPVDGGLTLQDAVELVRIVAETGRLVGIDVAEINPQIGTEKDAKTSVESAVELVKAAVGLLSDCTSSE